jgi:hypothetical protein
MKDKMLHEKSSVNGSRDYNLEYYSYPTGVEETTAILTAIPPLVSILKTIKGDGVDANPYESDSPEGKEYDSALADADKNGDLTAPELDQSKLDEITKAGEEDAKNGGDDTDKIWGMNKYVVYTGGAILVGLALWGIVKLVSGGKAKVAAK